MLAFLPIIRTLAISLILSCAGLISVLRLSLPWLAQHPSTLSTWASEYLNTPVQIQTLQAEWSAWGPVLRAQGIQFGASEHPIQIASATFAFSASGPRLTLTSPKVTLAHTETAGWHILGMPPQKDRSGFIRQLSVHNATLHWASGTTPPFTLSKIDMVKNGQNTHIIAELQHSLGPAKMQAVISANQSDTYWQLPGLAQHPIFATIQHHPSKPSVHLSAAELPIGPLSKLLTQLPALADWQSNLQQQNPTGTLQNVQATWYPKQPNTWSLDTKVTNFTVQPWQKLPGINNLQAELNLQPEHITAKFQATKTILDYPSVFRAPLTITQLDGTLHVQQTAEGIWQLHTDTIQLDTADFSSHSRMQLTLPAERSPHLEIRTQLQRGSLETVKAYLPVHQMSTKLVKWLDHALDFGHIIQSDLLFSGPLDSFPYEKKRNGVFNVSTQIRDGSLAYHSDWPPLHIKKAQLDFSQNSMSADVKAGRLFNTSVKTQATIPQLSTSSPLQLAIQAKGPFQELLDLLQTPTLNDNIRQLAARMQASGTAQTALQISIPLKKSEQRVQVDGDIQLTDAELQLSKITLKQIQGTLTIRDNHLQAEAVQTVIRGQPAQISIQPNSEHTLIQLETHLTPTSIQQWLPQIPIDRFHGSAAAHISLTLPKQSTGENPFNQLQINSNLKGLRIKLPVPIGKTQNTKRPLRLSLSLGNARKPHRLQYGRDGYGVFSHDWQRGELRYAAKRATLPKTGYRLQGNFQHLDLQAWLDSWKTLPKSSGKHSWEIAIAAKKIHYPPFKLDNAELKVRRTPQRFDGEVRSQQLIGQAKYDKQQLKVYLDKAHLNWPTSNTKESKKRPGTEKFIPQNWPSLRLLCEDLRLDHVPFGQLFIDTEANKTGQTLKKIRLQGNNLLLKAKGNWQTNQTHLKGAFQTADLGTLLNQLGQARQLKDAAAKGTFDLQWLGHPFQATTATLTGKAGLTIGPGRLAKISPGITRVLGLVNVDTFTRRLKLDFADLFKKGYTFDRIQGNFSFGKGQAHTRDLQIDGPTSQIQTGGRIGLVAQDFEQLVYITPKLDGTLLLAGAIAGGPVGTLTSLLVQQLLHRTVDRFSRFEYSVTGTWQDPKIMALDSGGALSDLINGLRQEKTQRKAPEQTDIIQPAQQRGVLQRIIDVFRPTDNDIGWTDEEILNLD